MLKEILELLKQTPEEREEVIQKVRELLDNGECVRSVLLGRMGQVRSIDSKGGISFIIQKCIGRKTISPNCRGYTLISKGDPAFIVKHPTEDCWYLVNEKNASILKNPNF